MVKHIEVSTFDSGFGGFFTAKAIADKAMTFLQMYNVEISVSHYGDTAHAPYGKKTEKEITDLTATGLIKAFDKGADFVFIACNTASTQYEAVKNIVEQKHKGRGRDIISIIDESVLAVKEQLDKVLISSNEAHFGLLSTAATMKSKQYPEALAAAYGGTLIFEEMRAFEQDYTGNGDKASFTQKSIIHLKNGKTIYIYHVSPENWVNMIENGGDDDVKDFYVKYDLSLLHDLLPKGKKFHVIGEFCTHYPVFDAEMKSFLKEWGSATDHTDFIVQAPLMALIFERRIQNLFNGLERSELLEEDSDCFKILVQNLRPTMTITGDNIYEMKELAEKSCHAPDTVVVKDHS